MVYCKKLFLVIAASLVWFGVAMVATECNAQCPNGNCQVRSTLPTRMVIADLGKPQPPVKKPAVILNAPTRQYKPLIRWKR